MTLDKVRIRQLPSVVPPIPEGGGRIASPAGELAQIANGQAFRFLAYIEFKPEASALRGNHYHARKVESLYIISGELLARYRDVETGDELEVTLSAGDLVEISPLCAHAYLPLTHTHAIEFSTTSYDPADTIKHDLGGFQGDGRPTR